MTAPVLSVVMPVFKEGEAVEPVLRVLTAAITEPHEILVVYDFDEDPTVPVIDRIAAELPPVRGLRNDLGRGVRPHLDGGRLGRAARRRLDGRAGARRRRRRVRVALHARWPADRWAA